LTSAVSGLLAQSLAISNVSTNLANSETTGYKAISTSFDDIVSGNYGSNATTIYSGVSAQTSQDVTEQGSIADTSTTTDLAIDGNGMFAVTEGTNGTSTYYTRDGSFEPDSSGNLYITGTDYYLQGYPTDSSGNVTSSTLTTVNVGAVSSAATATTTYSLSANLPAEEQSSVYSVSYSNDSTNATESVSYAYSTVSTDSSGNTTYLLSVTPSNSSATLTDDDGNTSTAGQPLLYDVTVDSSGDISSVVNAQTGQTTGTSPALPSVTPSDSSSEVTAPTSWSDLGSSTSLSSSITVYDSLGTAETLPVSYTAEGNNQWLMTVSTPTGGSLTDSTGATVSSYSYQVTFNSDGSLGSVTPLSTSTGGTAPMAGTNEPELSATWSDGAKASAVTLNLGTAGTTTGLSQFDSGDTTPSVDVKNSSQNGVPYGTLSSVAVNSSGEVEATYTNGTTVPIYKIPVATFPNEDGLTALSDNVYQASATSGTAILNTAGSNGAGTIEGGALESSTTDTTTEFAAMITAQQAYSASSQTISVDKQDFTTLMQSVS
jgi:flagellar hook protein FlgE